MHLYIYNFICSFVCWLVCPSITFELLGWFLQIVLTSSNSYNFLLNFVLLWQWIKLQGKLFPLQESTSERPAFHMVICTLRAQEWLVQTIKVSSIGSCDAQGKGAALMNTGLTSSFTKDNLTVDLTDRIYLAV